MSSPYVGGGFGSKTLWHHHVLAAAASKTRRTGRYGSFFRVKGYIVPSVDARQRSSASP